MRSFLALVLFALMVTSLPAVADAPPRFSAEHRDLITTYARDHARVTIALTESRRYDAPVFKHPSDNSPHFVGVWPGKSQTLIRGRSLPPAINKVVLPEPLMRKLPPVPKNHEIVVVDGRVLLVDIQTQRIRDRLAGVILR